MPDKAKQALTDLYSSWMTELGSNPEMPMDAIRGLFEHWGDVTAEPGHCDYVLTDLGGIEAMWVIPKGYEGTKVLLCAHGGGYVLGSMYSHRKMFGHFAAKIGCRALIVNYARAPENQHPGPVTDMARGYRWLLDVWGAESSDIALLGDSAGGSLAVTTMLLARDMGLPLPAAAIALAPYFDMEAKGDSYDRNAHIDKLGNREGNLQFIKVFLGEGSDPRDPLANPLFADLTGLPPILLQVGSEDVLCDDSVAFHARAQDAGVSTELEVYAGMPHVFHFLAGNHPEADAAITKAAAWLKPQLGL
jgi:monoterpene epsilon-lactone hydrolase